MKEDYKKLLKRYNSTQESLRDAVNRLNYCSQRNNILEAEKRQWEQQKLLQTKIIESQLKQKDAEKEIIQNEIIELKKKFGVRT